MTFSNSIFASAVAALWLFPVAAAGQAACDECDVSFAVDRLDTISFLCRDGSPLDAAPEFPAYSYDEDCGLPWAGFFKYTTGNMSSCEAIRPSDLPPTMGSIQVLDFTTTGLATSNAFNDNEEGLTWAVYEGNLARLFGTVQNANDPNAQFEVDLFFENGVSGETWTNNGNGINDDIANPSDVEGWTVWQLKPLMSKLVGLGNLDGIALYLTEGKADDDYRFQSGTGANGVNSNDGLGGTFDWVTCIDGVPYGGTGSSALSFASCGTQSYTCASDNDAVAHFFIGTLTGFDQLEAYVDAVDDVPPVLHNLPDDVFQNCPIDLGALDADLNVSADDECSSFDLTMDEAFVNGSCPNEFTRIRTFTATDACGRTTQHVQTVEVFDTLAPALTVPGNVAFDCDEEVIYDDAEAMDACDGFLSVVEEDPVLVNGDCPGEYTVFRTFSATDLCGNTTSGEQVILVRDLTPPVLNMPEDVVLPCGSGFVYPPATATDNCTDDNDIDIDIFNSIGTSTCPNEYVLERRFIATDLCDNYVLELQTVTVTDLDPPYFTFVPADTSYSCTESPNLAEAVAQDDCSDFDMEIQIDTVGQGCQNNYDLIRTFIATDECGNMAEATQVVSVRDVEAPVILSDLDNPTVECDDMWIPQIPEANDNCSPVSWAVDVDTIGVASSGSYNLQVLYVASDACGNESSIGQTVTVVDITPPVFISPIENTTISCDDDVPLILPDVEDNCSTVNIAWEDNLETDVAPGVDELTRTFSVTDVQGNVSTAVQVISIVDNVPPSFIVVPSDYSTECSDEIIFADPTASDNCSEVLISETRAVIDGNAIGNYTVVRTFTATDDAGNSTSAQQTITVQDTTAPELSVPADYTSECDVDLILDDATASDNCGEVTIEVSSETIAGDAAGNYTVVRTFTATDDAGNSTSAQQTITVQDTTAPELSIPADYTSECDADLILDDATATDNCGEVTIEVSSETIAGDAAGNYTVVRTFTATDDAGNSSSAQQTITVQDTKAPELSIPADYTSECDADLILDDATATDNCGEVTIEVSSETIAGDAAGNYTVVRTFTATDDAGNSTSAQQTITVQDTTAPELSIPADYTSECDADLILDDATATDNCGEVTIEVSSETIAGDAAGNYTVVRTFTATDDAGNSSSAQQTITVQDTTAPELSVPADYTSECDADLILDDATASDNCGEVTIEVSSETIAGDAAGNYTVVRTFTATDDAGNSTSAQQTITVQDTTAPELSIPADYTSECDAALILDDATASDNCGEVTIEVSSETIAGDAAGNYTVVRTFTATDDAGNSTSAQQTITVQDTTAPELSIPADYTSECDADLIFDDATATDNCGEVTIEVSSETIAGDAAGNYIVVRTFTATDDAGNSSSAQQTIIVQDTKAPELSIPADYTSECDADLILDDATATDNCGEVTIEVSSETIAGDAAGNYTVVRTFTATDDAGNSTSAQQTITVQDTTAPEFIYVPASTEVECSDEWPLEAVLVEDGCGLVTVTETVDTLPGSCGTLVVLVRSFTAVDDAGNTSTASQTLTQVDTQGPVFDVVEEVDISCSGGLNQIPIPSVTDPCSAGELPLVFNSVSVSGGCTLPVSTIVRTYTSMDECGNISTAEQIIQLVDSEFPQWDFFPADQTLECSASYTFVPATAIDNCAEPNVTWSADTIGDIETGMYDVVYAFEATDDCDNSISRSQVVRFVDTTAPEFTFVPNDFSIECSEAIAFEDALATDACSVATVTEERDTLIGNATGNFIITRTFTAVDVQGNPVWATQTITVEDTTPPEFTSFPADIVVDCAEDIPLDMPTAVDNCSEVNVTFSETSSAGTGSVKYTLERTFQAMDASGNFVTQLQTITVEDTAPPEFTSVPGDLTVECSEDIPFENAEATDVCGDVLVSDTVIFVPGSAAGDYTLIRIFTAMDEVGLSVQDTSVITVTDTTPPVLFTSLTNSLLQCGEDTAPLDLDVSDACSDTTFVTVDDIEEEGACEGERSIFRTYALTDDAGNMAQYEVILTIVDTVAPTFVYAPPATTWECNQEVVLDSAWAMDACSDVVIDAALDTLSSLGANQWELEVVWTATDACGNASEHRQPVNVIDSEVPLIVGGPAGTTLPWGESLPLDMWEMELQYSDLCTDTLSLQVTVEVDTLEAAVACNDELTLTWTVTDLSGNQDVWIQPVTLVDVDSPVFLDTPETLTLPCDSTWVPVYPEVMDHNEILPFSEILDTLIGDCPQNQTLIWTLSMEDVCGNTSGNWTQEIQLLDSVAPVMSSGPIDAIVNSPEEVPDCDIDSMTWSDNCGLVNVLCGDWDTLEVYCPGSFLLTQTILAVDECGNSSSVQQNILVQDIEPPVFVDLPLELTSTCDIPVEAPGAIEVTATDNQSDSTDIDVVRFSEGMVGDVCDWTETFVYTATDGCGNPVSQELVLSFGDNEPPIVTEDLPDLEFFCANEVPPFDLEDLWPIVEDNCGWTTATATDTYEDGECTGPDCVLIRTIEVVDDCGNTTSLQQRMAISEPPTVPELPSGFSPNNDGFNDIYQIRNAGPDMGVPPCDWIENTSMTVFDRWGTVVYTSTDVSVPWDGSNTNGRPLPVGTYFVVFEANGQSYTKTVDLRR